MTQKDEKVDSDQHEINIKIIIMFIIENSYLCTWTSIWIIEVDVIR